MEFVPEFDYFQNPAAKIRDNSDPTNNLGTSMLIDLGVVFFVLFCFCITFNKGTLTGTIRTI